MKNLILAASFALSACAGSKPEPEKQAQKYYTVACKGADGTQTMAIYAVADSTPEEVLRDSRDRLKPPATCTVKNVN